MPEGGAHHVLDVALAWIREQVSAGQQRGAETVAFQVIREAIVGCVEGAKDIYYDERRLVDPTDYDGYNGKDELRASLCTEQHGLCCYCMGRIRPDLTSMKIEHRQSRSRHPNQRLVYANLLGACMGGKGYRQKDQYCDTFKDDKDLCRNPANPAHNVEAFIRYAKDGTISATDATFDDHLNSVLNLNLPFLKENRRQQIENFKRFVSVRPGTRSREQWQKLLNEWTGVTGAGQLQPYAGVVASWIRKHLV